MRRPVNPDRYRPFGASHRLGFVLGTSYVRYDRVSLMADRALPAVIVCPQPVWDVLLACLKGPMHHNTVVISTDG